MFLKYSSEFWTISLEYACVFERIEFLSETVFGVFIGVWRSIGKYCNRVFIVRQLLLVNLSEVSAKYLGSIRFLIYWNFVSILNYFQARKNTDHTPHFTQASIINSHPDSKLPVCRHCIGQIANDPRQGAQFISGTLLNSSLTGHQRSIRSHEDLVSICHTYNMQHNKMVNTTWLNSECLISVQYDRSRGVHSVHTKRSHKCTYSFIHTQARISD